MRLWRRKRRGDQPKPEPMREYDREMSRDSSESNDYFAPE